MNEEDGMGGGGRHRATVFPRKYLSPVAATNGLSIGNKSANKGGDGAGVNRGDVVVEDCVGGFDDGHVH